MTLVIGVVLVTLSVSFLCSLCEAALYAVSPSRVEALRQCSRNGRKLARLRERMDEAIAGILTLNTITHTIGASWTGALVADLYGNSALGVFAAVFTLAVLILTEIVPKSIGVAWSGMLAPRLVWVIQAMIWSVWPLARICMWLMQRITRRAPGQEPSEEEILIMTDLAARRGSILPQESLWVKNVLRLNNVAVHELMTPRRVVFSLPADRSLDRVEMHADHWVHSRVPVTDGPDLDRVVGVVQRRAVFDHLMREEYDKSLGELSRPAMFVPEEMRGHRLLEQLINQRQHLAVVKDKAGRVSGVVTLEDILEYLLGADIVGEHDAHPEMRRMLRERDRFHEADQEENNRAKLQKPATGD